MGLSWRQRAVDAAAVVLVSAIVSIMIHEAREPGARPPDPQAFLLAFLMALPILAHRRRPISALLLSSLALFVYYASGYPGISPTTSQAIPIYSAVLAGHLRWAVGVTLMFYSVGFAMVTVEKQLTPLLALSEFLTHIGFAIAVILLAEVARSRRALAAETRERLRLAAEERERETARRVAEDRVRVARELHDTLAHSMATIAVQAGSALYVLGDGDERVRPALTAIRETSKDALHQLRSTLGVLRSGAELDPAVGLARLPALVEAVQAAGVPVELTVTGDAAALDPPVDHAAYRILQESLTNVLRHAGPRVRARVTVAHRAGGLELEIVDDGTGGTPEGGHGLTGMRERTVALGGTFQAGPRAGGGFAVRASLPGGAP